MQPYPYTLTRRRGALVKGGQVMGAPAACFSVALDEAGTLITGVLVASGMVAPAAVDRPPLRRQLAQRCARIALCRWCR